MDLDPHVSALIEVTASGSKFKMRIRVQVYKLHLNFTEIFTQKVPKKFN